MIKINTNSGRSLEKGCISLNNELDIQLNQLLKQQLYDIRWDENNSLADVIQQNITNEYFSS